MVRIRRRIADDEEEEENKEKDEEEDENEQENDNEVVTLWSRFWAMGRETYPATAQLYPVSSRR